MHILQFYREFSRHYHKRSKILATNIHFVTLANSHYQYFWLTLAGQHSIANLIIGATDWLIDEWWTNRPCSQQEWLESCGRYPLLSWSAHWSWTWARRLIVLLMSTPEEIPLHHACTGLSLHWTLPSGEEGNGKQMLVSESIHPFRSWDVKSLGACILTEFVARRHGWPIAADKFWHRFYHSAYGRNKLLLFSLCASDIQSHHQQRWSSVAHEGQKGSPSCSKPSTAKTFYWAKLWYTNFGNLRAYKISTKMSFWH